MKKHRFRLLSVLMLAALLCTLAVSAWADSPSGQITIRGAASGETYSLYKLFDLKDYDPASDQYSYRVTAAWERFFARNAPGAAYLTLDGDGRPAWTAAEDADTAAAFAKAALAWAGENSIEPAAVQRASGTLVTFADLDYGYYLIDTTAGALCSLTTAAPTAQLEEKNAAPTLSKTVNGGASCSASVGDTVHYSVIVTLPEGMRSCILQDTMSEGLTFVPGSVQVTADGTAVDTSAYTLDTAPASGATFSIRFADSLTTALSAGAKLTVTYDAVLNEKAVVDGTGSSNRALLNYNNASETLPAETTVYTHAFDLIKVDGRTHELLAGAAFRLYDANGTALRLVQTGNGRYRAAMAGETAVDTLETRADTALRISGLAKGVYWLEEATAPEGYNRLTEQVKVDLTAGSSTSTLTGTLWDNSVSGGVVIQNNTGATLPETGGRGTTLFYVVGGGLMAAAAVLLVVKKRLEHKD